MDRLIGVFGGTFDPPHLGHLILADCARTALPLEKVLWVLTPHPPHKPQVPVTPVELRMQMLEAALGDDPGFELSRADVDRPPPHYAVGTLQAIRRALPGARLLYLMGSDSLHDLTSWHQPERFVELCDALGVMRRAGFEIEGVEQEERIPGLQAKVRYFDAPVIEISSSDIRRRVRDGDPYRYMVPVPVADLIRGNDLYR